MAKTIKSYKNLPIIWRANRNCFQLSLRAIGGGQRKFKPEAVAAAKCLLIAVAHLYSWLVSPYCRRAGTSSGGVISNPFAVQQVIEKAPMRAITVISSSVVNAASASA